MRSVAPATTVVRWLVLLFLEASQLAGGFGQVGGRELALGQPGGQGGGLLQQGRYHGGERGVIGRFDVAAAVAHATGQVIILVGFAGGVGLQGGGQAEDQGLKLGFSPGSLLGSRAAVVAHHDSFQQAGLGKNGGVLVAQGGDVDFEGGVEGLVGEQTGGGGSVAQELRIELVVVYFAERLG